MADATRPHLQGACMSISRRQRLVWLPPILLVLAVLGCTVPGGLSSSAAIGTQAALTMEAQWAARAPVSPSPALPASTSTLAPAASDTPAPTLPPLATDSAGCTDQAAFVADLTIPDNTNLPAGGAFTKAWRLKNTGTCTWTPNYNLVFIDGDNFGATQSQSIPGNVAPGEDVDLSLELRAPVTPGVHRGNWKLLSSRGTVFGIDGSGSFYVQIVVGATLTPGTGGRTVYELAANYCEAEWRSGAGVLPCPGTEGDPNGYVLRVQDPRFENGITEDEPSLLTRPQMSTDGVISGRYPPLQVLSGYRLKTHIGCRYDSTECNVIYQLNYRIDGGTLQNLGQWSQRYDGEWQKLDIDLSSLSGRSVEFVLAVAANGASSADDALWLNPKITQ